MIGGRNACIDRLLVGSLRGERRYERRIDLVGGGLHPACQDNWWRQKAPNLPIQLSDYSYENKISLTWLETPSIAFSRPERVTVDGPRSFFPAATSFGITSAEPSSLEWSEVR